MPHPNFVPVRPNSSRRTHSSGVCGSASVSYAFRLTLSFITSHLTYWAGELLKELNEKKDSTIVYHRILLLRVRISACLYADFNCSGRMGRLRTLFPVAAKIALATAGAIGGVPGSPTPPCFSVLGTMYASIRGASFMRTIL